MPRYCSASGCKSRDTRESRKSGVTYHRLPKCTARRDLWISNSRRTGPQGQGKWVPKSKFIYFCSRHFTTESFELTGVSGYRRLKDDAYPTMFEKPKPRGRGRGRPPKGKTSKTSVSPKDKSISGSLNLDSGNQKGTQNEAVKPYSVQQESLSSVSTDVQTEKNVEGDVSAPGVTDLVSETIQNSCQLKPSPSLQDPPQSTLCPNSQRPHSPSRYMRRLPPPLGFYLPKEHNYAQLCPLAWRKRYDRAIDNLEKSLRLLSAARRRENRLRNTLLRLRESRLKQTLLRSQEVIKVRGFQIPDSEIRSQGEHRADRSSTGQEDSEIDGVPEHLGLFEDIPLDTMDWAAKGSTTNPKVGSEGENSYCFYCGRGQEDCWSRSPQITEDEKVNKRDKYVYKERGFPKKIQSKIIGGTMTKARASQESNEDNYSSGSAESIKDLKVVMLQMPLEKVKCAVNKHSSSQLQIPLLQAQAQFGCQQMQSSTGQILHNTHVQRIETNQVSLQELLLTDPNLLGEEHASRPQQEQLVFWMLQNAGGQLLLMPVPTEDGLKCNLNGGADDTQVQTILSSTREFHRELAENMSLDSGEGELRVKIPDDGQRVHQSDVRTTVVVGDVREKLKEHLEGFQLQLSNESNM